MKKSGKKNARSEAEVEIVDVLTAHRYMLPFPEVAGAILMASNCIIEGSVEVYRSKKTGGLMLGYVCPDCDTHHPLIEIHALPVESDIGIDDRMIVQSFGCPIYRDMLRISGEMLHSVDATHAQSRDLVMRKGYRFDEEGPTDTRRVFDLIPAAVEAILDGVATFALDTKSGMTALGVPCGEDCPAIHGAFLLAMPKFRDMRNAAGYEFLGNPFMDMMLEETGRRRH